MGKIYKWIMESNRPKHIVAGFLIGVVGGLICVLIAAAAVEFKDWRWRGSQGGTWGWLKGNGFDWLDYLATAIGGVLGSVIYELAKVLILV